MAKATKPNSETKRKLLDAAMKLMIAKGFKATTIDEICSEVGLTKGSFFHYFDGKDDVAKAAATHFHEFQQCMFDGADFRSITDPLDRVHGRLDFLVGLASNPQIPKSCLIGNLAQEVSGTHDDIRRVCQGAFESGAADFERDVAEAKLKYAPKASFDPASLGRLYLTTIQGSMVMAKAAKNPGILAENVEHLRRYIESLFGENRSRKK